VVTGHRPSHCEKQPRDCIASIGVPGGGSGGPGGGTGGNAGGGSPGTITKLLDAINDMNCDQLNEQIGKWKDKIAEATANIASLTGYAETLQRELASIDKYLRGNADLIQQSAAAYEQLRRARTAECQDPDQPGSVGRPKGNKPLCGAPGAAERKAKQRLDEVLANDASERLRRGGLQAQADKYSGPITENKNAIKTFSAIAKRAEDQKRAKHCKA
jgi:DNA repair exonuclease SbcCD ATPase subunit